MNFIVTVPYKETYSMPLLCCVCGKAPAPYAKRVDIRKGFNAGREITVTTQLPVCLDCQKSTEAATSSNVRAILAGFGGFVLSFGVFAVLGAIARALNLGDAGTTIGMVLGVVCMVALPILFARPFIARRDPEAVKVRWQYEKVQCHTMMATTIDADVVLEVSSAAFATAFAQQNGGTAIEGSFLLGVVVPAKTVQ